MLGEMESSNKTHPPMSAPVDRVDIITLAINQLAIAQAVISRLEAGDFSEREAEAIEDQIKGCIQQASQYSALAHRGKRLVIVEIGLPDLEREEC